MTPMTKTGIDAKSLHGHIRLYLIIKNTLLAGARTLSIEILLHYTLITSMVDKPCMDPILDLNDVISNKQEPLYYGGIQASLHPISTSLSLLM